VTAIRAEINEKEVVIERKKGIDHLLFGLSALPLAVGFFVLVVDLI